MNIETLKNPTFQFITVDKPGALTASIIITSDRFAENSDKTVALGLIYSDLLLSGAGKFSREDFTHALDLLGSSMQVSESGGRVTVTITSLAEKLSKTLALFSMMLESPAFKPTELKRAKQSIANSIELYKENAQALASDGLSRALFKKSDRRYKNTPEAITKALSTVTVKDLGLFHKSFVQTYWTVTVGGNEKTIKIVDKTITKFKKSVPLQEKISTMSDINEITSKKVVTQSVPSKQNIELSIGANIPLTMTCPEFPDFLFGLTVLGKWAGFAGRLMSIVREKEGLTYGIYARVEGVSERENGSWRIMTFFSPKDVKTGIESTLREINKIHKNGITESEWKRFKVILETEDQLIYDSLVRTVGKVHSIVTLGMGWGEYQQCRERLHNSTQVGINSALKKYLDPSKIVISAAGPVKGVEKELKGFEG